MFKSWAVLVLPVLSAVAGENHYGFQDGESQIEKHGSHHNGGQVGAWRPVCETTKCLRFTATLKTTMTRRETPNPCNMWDEFVCGKYGRSKATDVYWLPDDRISYGYNEMMERIAISDMEKLYEDPSAFDEMRHPSPPLVPDPDRDGGIYAMMIKYWNKCANQFDHRGFNWSTLRQFDFLNNMVLSAFETYDEFYRAAPVNTNKRINVHDHELIGDAAAKLGRYGVWSFAEYGVHKSLFDADKKSIYLKPWIPKGLPYKELWISQDVVYKYESIISQWLETAIHDGSDHKVFIQLAKSLTALEREILKIAPTEQEMEGFDNWTIMSAKKLDTLVPELNLPKLFDIHNDPEGLVKSAVTEIEVSFPQYWRKLSKVLQRQRRGTVRAWFLWQIYLQNQDMIADYEPVVQYRNLMSRVKGREAGPSKRLMCDRRTFEIFDHYAGSLFLNGTLSSTERFMGNEIVNNIKKEYMKIIEETPWLSQEGKTKALDKAGKLTVMVGGQSENPNIMNWDDLFAYYRDDKLMAGKDWWNEPDIPTQVENDRFHGYDIWRVKRRKLEKALETLDEAPQEYAWNRPAWSSQAGYNHQTNKLVLPAGMFRSAMFDTQGPSFVNYALFGVNAATEMARALGQIGTHMSHNGTIDDWLPEEDREKFNKRVQCFHNKYHGMNLTEWELTGTSVDDYRVDSSKVLESIMADTNGADMAYRAWKAEQDTRKDMSAPEFTEYSLESVYKDRSLPEFTHYTNAQQFWLLQSLVHCHRLNAGSWEDLMSHGLDAPPVVRLKRTVQDLESWYEAWQCPVREDRPMCRLYGKNHGIQKYTVRWWGRDQ